MSPPAETGSAQANDQQASVQRLDYFPAERYRTLRMTIRIVAASCLVAIAFALHHFWGDLRYDTLRWIRCQRILQNHIPPNTVLWVDDPAEIKRLPTTNTEYVPWGQEGREPLRAVYAPRIWRDYAQYLTGSLGADGAVEGEGITFCGMRKSPHGNRRLVILSRGPEDVADLPDGGWWFDVVQPAPLFGPDPTDVWGWTNSFNYSKWQSWGVSWRPAVADERDLSHCTLDFSLWNGSKDERGRAMPAQWHGTIDIYLQDDDHLRFACRTPWLSPGPD